MPSLRWLKLLGQGSRFCGACVLAFAVWTLWLALALLLAGQCYIAAHNELEVPGFVLRALEERLAASGVRVTFGRTSFDPTGRVLIEEARVLLPAFSEPVATARAIYAQLDPWALATGKFEPREVRVTGASLAIPAMLSRSGAAEEVLADLDATFVSGENVLTLAHLSGRIAGVAVSARGSVYVPSAGTTHGSPLPVADFLARNFSTFCRQLDAVSTQLAALDQPELHLELSPSESRTAIASVTLFARGWKLDTPQPLQISGLQIITRFPLLGDSPVATQLELTAEDLALPFRARAHGVHALIRGTLRPTQLSYTPREFQLSAESLAASDILATALTANLTPGPLPQIEGDVVARFLGLPLALRASADFKAETATVHFDGSIAPGVLGLISSRVHTDVRQYFDFAALDCTDGLVQLGPGWKFEKISARTALRSIDAYHVHMDEGRAVVEFDGRHFHAPEAWARLGENFAHGTYDHDLVTREYRFLLEGQLRPLDIAGWFRAGWWTRFFQQFDLPVAPPQASVDVQGRWTEGRRSNVFVFVDTRGPVIRGAKLDFARARLFIRPAFFDVFELFATSGPGAAHGTFCYTADPATFAWHRLDFDLASTIDPAVAVKMLGSPDASPFGPIAFAQPPDLKLSGRIDGPTAPGGAHQSVDIEAHSAGEFRVHDFPLASIAFTAAVRDDVLTVDNLRAGFASGLVTGRLKLSGRGADRRVNADLALQEASLGGVVATLQDYAAHLHGTPPPPPGKFVQEKASLRLDLTASAEGRYADPFSYQGEGHATLQGAGLGEVRLLGLLSELLKFTALRFTTAQASFKIEGPKLVFPEVQLTGANSAINAEGSYALDKRLLDFTAKIYPFHESGNLFKKGLEVVLAPLTNVFEVVLTGTLDDPKWAFAIGPTNLLRSLAPSETPPPDKPKDSAPVSPEGTPEIPPASKPTG